MDVDSPIGLISIHVDAGTYSLNVGNGRTLVLTLKDKDGNVISTNTIEGPFMGDLPLPEAYSSYDYNESNTKLKGLWPGPVVLRPKAKKPMHLVGCTSNPFDPNASSWIQHQAAIPAGTPEQADARFTLLSATGAGGVVPEDVFIHTWIDVSATTLTTTIVSSLHDDFLEFVVTVDGVPTADLSAGLNVVVQPLANGWNRVITTLPSSLALTDSEVKIHQQGASETAATAMITVDIS